LQKWYFRLLEKLLDLYTDYLLSSFGQITCTGLSRLLDVSQSHDKLSRLLSTNEFTSTDLWEQVKPLVRAHERADACLIFDDTIISKPYTDEK
jgi:CII-binding regulator of phage lambda lysogenization HflD